MKDIIMKSSFLILKEKKLVIDIYDGILTLDTFKGHKLKQVNHPDFDPTFNLLSDFTTIEVRLSLEDVKAYAEFVKQYSKIIVAKRKAAVVLSNPNQFVYAKQYDKLVKDDTAQQLYTFLSFDESLKYLGIFEDKEEIMRLIKEYHDNPMFEWKIGGDSFYL